MLRGCCAHFCRDVSVLDLLHPGWRPSGDSLALPQVDEDLLERGNEVLEELIAHRDLVDVTHLVYRELRRREANELARRNAFYVVQVVF